VEASHGAVEVAQEKRKARHLAGLFMQRDTCRLAMPSTCGGHRSGWPRPTRSFFKLHLRPGDHPGLVFGIDPFSSPRLGRSDQVRRGRLLPAREAGDKNLGLARGVVVEHFVGVSPAKSVIERYRVHGLCSCTR